MIFRHLIEMMIAWCVMQVGSGCSAASEGLYNTTEGPTHASPTTSPEIRCNIIPGKDGSSLIAYEISNLSADTIHIINDNKNAPYQLMRNSDTLVIFHGLHAHDSRALPHIIEIPTTRSLRPGEILSGKTVWPMRAMRDYYGGHGTPVSLLHGAIKVRCEAGWWSVPITEADRARLLFPQVLASQHIIGYGPLELLLP